MRTKMVLLGVAVLSAGILAACFAFPDAKTPSKTEASPITGYKRWTRVNEKPQWVVSYVALLCRNVLPEEVEREKTNPHNDKFMIVYVNAAGRKAMLEQKLPRFPVGSVIVKEKHPSEKSKTPELLTVMRKREKGYNPKQGDWEYLVFDGDGKKSQAAGRLENCQNCHKQWKEGDYVSRRYLPYEIRERLR